MIFGTNQPFILNTTVDSIFSRFIMQGGETRRKLTTQDFAFNECLMGIQQSAISITCLALADWTNYWITVVFWISIHSIAPKTMQICVGILNMSIWMQWSHLIFLVKTQELIYCYDVQPALHVVFDQYRFNRSVSEPCWIVPKIMWIGSHVLKQSNVVV